MFLFTSLQTPAPAKAIKNLVFEEEKSSDNESSDPSLEPSNPVESLGQFVGAILVIAGAREVAGPEAGEQQGQEEVEDDQVANDDGGEEEGDTDLTNQKTVLCHVTHLPRTCQQGASQDSRWQDHSSPLTA